MNIDKLVALILCILYKFYFILLIFRKIDDKIE